MTTMTLPHYDIFFGEGNDRVNLGLIIAKYNGGITKIQNGVGSTWNNEYSSGYGRYGNSWAYHKLGSKPIVVHFELIGYPHEYEGFREELASALDCPNGPRKLVFNRNPNKYYKAVVSGSIDLDESIEEAKATGSFSFDVPDGCSHYELGKVLNKDTVDPDIGSYRQIGTDVVEIVINNQGSADCYPVFKIQHTESDNGYIGIATPYGLMEVGTKEATSDGTMLDSGTVKSEVLTNIKVGDSSNTTGWGQFKDASATYKESPISSKVCINGGSMRYGENHIGYGSKGFEWARNGGWLPGYRWTGGIAEMVIPADSNGESGAINWRADFNIKVWEQKLGMTGYLTIILADSAGRSIAAYDLAKDDTTGDLMYANFLVGTTQKQVLRFGANDGEKGQKNPNIAFRNTKGAAYIIKDGPKFTFGYNGTPYTFTESSMENKVVSKIIITSGRYQNEAPSRGFISKLIVESLKFTKNNTRRYDLVPNKFTAGSRVDINNYEGRITIIPDPKTSKSAEKADDELALDSDFIIFPKGISKCEIYFSSWITAPPEVTVEWYESDIT